MEEGNTQSSRRHDGGDRTVNRPMTPEVVDDETPEPVDDGIAVGVPPAPTSAPFTHPPTASQSSVPGSPLGPGSKEQLEKLERAVDAVDAGYPEQLEYAERLERLTAERDEYLGALQRLQADFENYRKRVLRQSDEQSARGALGLVEKLLPVLDTLDLAHDHLTSSVQSSVREEADALGQARLQLLDLLTKEGLERFDEVGVEFDPVIHDAVAHSEPQDVDPSSSAVQQSVVDEVMRAGYRWRGQVLRPAIVRVRG
ncbi:MAG: nucleotide exchange factor GrpE [Acidimicrobiales bacterium]